MQVVDAGEYYSTPPLVVITDRLGKGSFANYTATLEDGKVVGFESLDQGKFYTKGNVIVEIFAVGRDATATCDVFTWTKNRYVKSHKKTLITIMVMLSLTTIVPGDLVMVFVLTPFN